MRNIATSCYSFGKTLRSIPSPKTTLIAAKSPPDPCAIAVSEYTTLADVDLIAKAQMS